MTSVGNHAELKKTEQTLEGQLHVVEKAIAYQTQWLCDYHFKERTELDYYLHDRIMRVWVEFKEKRRDIRSQLFDLRNSHLRASA